MAILSKRSWLIVFITCLIVISACHHSDLVAQKQSDCERFQIQHHGGITEVCPSPKTIAVLSPPLLDILLTLGLQPAAHAEVDLLAKPIFDRPSEQIPYLGQFVTTQPINLGDRSNPSLEALLRLKPDLIIGEDYQNTSPLLSKIAPTLFFEIPANKGWQSVLLSLAPVFGREIEARSKLDQYDQLIEQTKQDLAPLIHGKTILVVGWERFSKQVFILESDSFVCELLRDLGFSVVAGESGRTDLSIEALPTILSDHVLVMPSGDSTINQAQEYWRANPLLGAIPAVQSGNVHFADFQLYRIRGPIAAELFIRQIQASLKHDKTPLL
ncbi:ABC transporter substrate-binding protein [Leptolyngbya sp. AN03gr2]|uniref:ABC transporter substrate-binding protein n=1 Tax=unclassified Leptolyngbya TaxID=2650499 RepID=UPI003D31CCD8